MATYVRLLHILQMLERFATLQNTVFNFMQQTVQSTIVRSPATHLRSARCPSQTQDYYTYTAVKYARDAGHDAIVELLGGKDDAAGWVGTEDLYAGMATGDDVEPSTPSGGLWIRHMDPETQLAYHMNDETGAS